ncbi:MAG: SDR family oxidoreductase [Schwartzia sp.]|nr:SDR family oxidoreductase [Schwartzia sp. (in: firmicutes)]
MKDKGVLVTGGTSGIGLEAARMFLAEGARVVVAGRDEARGEAALRALDDERAFFFSADVRNAADCESLVRRAKDALGRLDALVCSAGVYREESAEALTEESYAEVMDTNVKGTMFMARAALPYLRETKGNIVNVASDAGLHGNYLCSLYCASKGAVVLYTRALALETASFGVRVNCVAPGDILTPLTEVQLKKAPSREEGLSAMASIYPLGRIGTAEEAASVVYFLASPRASFVTGACWSVDGGLTA